MTDWTKPKEVDDVHLAFPVNIDEWLPSWDEIPEDFREGLSDQAHKWRKFQGDWFFGGLMDVEVDLKEGIDEKTAWRHLGTIQGSYDPKHEHKVAAVAWLASLWFNDIRYKKGRRDFSRG